MKDLPITQAGVSRHKCAICAYESGYLEGYRIAIEAIVSRMPRSKEDIIKARDADGISIAKKIAISIRNKRMCDTNKEV